MIKLIVSLLLRPLAWLTKLTRFLRFGSVGNINGNTSQSITHPNHGIVSIKTPDRLLQEKLLLRQGLQEAQKNGTVHPQAAEIAIRALMFGELTVADVMVPRNRVHALPINAPFEHIKRVLLEEAHSCMPVYDGTLDHIMGVLVAKDVLALAWQKELIVLQDLLQPPFFAPEIMRAIDLLKHLQRRRMHFAIAVNELGGTAGIVTIEDLLEELVGDIFGEHDTHNDNQIRHEANGNILVPGTVPIRDLNRELQLNLHEGDTWSTLGGLCISLAGRIPEVGNKLAVHNGMTLEIVDASAKRVRLIRLHRQSDLASTANITI